VLAILRKHQAILLPGRCCSTIVLPGRLAPSLGAEPDPRLLIEAVDAFIDGPLTQFVAGDG
jgi:hypothetical protein